MANKEKSMERQWLYRGPIGSIVHGTPVDVRRIPNGRPRSLSRVVIGGTNRELDAKMYHIVIGYGCYSDFESLENGNILYEKLCVTLKLFCYFKKLHNAAIVVQKHFRLKKMNHTGTSSCPSTDIPEHPTLNGQSIRIQIPQNNSSLLREHRAATTIQLAYRGHRKRQAAARKIQKFMKENRMKLRKIQGLSDPDSPVTMAMAPSSP